MRELLKELFSLAFSLSFSLSGRIGRRNYAVYGIVLFLVKYNIDRLLNAVYCKREWKLWHYLISAAASSIAHIKAGDAWCSVLMLFVALPFIWMGLALTVKRLRDAGLPPALVAVFFLPFINILFFFILTAVPPAAEAPGEAEERQGRLAALIPRSRTGSMIFALLFTLAVGLLFVLFSVQALRNYGWGLFVGIPFMMGFVSALVYSYHEYRTKLECFRIALSSITLLGVVVLGFAIEGIVCLVMAAPLALVLSLFGGGIAYALQRSLRNRTGNVAACVAVPLLLPLLMTVEHYTAGEGSLRKVTSVIEIDAHPAEVWENVISFPELPPPEGWLFKTGIAYPLRARIDGAGVGAVRHCEFSTGAFVEPITVWDEPALLRFSVESSPPPLEEWTLFEQTAPPHLKGFFLAEQGEFRLTPLARGRTRVEGSTWYRHTIWPEPYWRVFSDHIVSEIHERVLEHIKATSEGAKVRANGAPLTAPRR